MKRLLSAILVAVLCLGAVLPLASCGENMKDPDVLRVCLASEPQTIDPALNSSVDGATMLAHLFSGLAKWDQVDGKLVIVPDCAEALPEGTLNADGTVTYVYTLRAGQKWSNGDELKASDFVNSWNRAASVELGADYGYMMEVIKGYDKLTAMVETGDVDDNGEAIMTREFPDAKLDVVADDAARTITVTLNNMVAYWNELLAFPSYYPVHSSCYDNDAWATSPKTYISNGAYTLTGWKHNSVITISKSEGYWDAANVTMKTIKFYLSDDANNMLSNFKNGTWLLIDDVPTNEIANLKSDYPTEFGVGSQIGTYYVCWNINENLLPASSTLTGVEKEKAQQEIRQALALVLDREYIVTDIAQGGQLPASSFVAMGMTDADGSQFYMNAGSSETYVGYYDASKTAVSANYTAAKAILDKYYTTDNPAPSFTYLYNTSEGHKAIGEYIQQAFANAGVTLTLQNQEWNTFLETRKKGDYSVARNGWLADFNDPISFLDMWVSYSGNNDVQFGKGDHATLAMYNLDLTGLGYTENIENGTWAETYDVLIGKIKTCTDTDKRYTMMHMAEDMLMATGCIVPLYYYTDLYMISDAVSGYYANPLGYKYFQKTTLNFED